MEKKKGGDGEENVKTFPFLLSSTALGSRVIALTSRPAGTEKATPRIVGQERKGSLREQGRKRPYKEHQGRELQGGVDLRPVSPW